MRRFSLAEVGLLPGESGSLPTEQTARPADDQEGGEPASTLAPMPTAAEIEEVECFNLGPRLPTAVALMPEKSHL